MAGSNKSKRYDFVIYGATGFTGKHCVKEMVRTAEQKNNLTWAVAGRNEKKLKEVLQKCNSVTKDLSDIPIIIADDSDPASLVEMCRRAKVVLNCVGPYHFHGEPVVKACIENGAHHIDISAEQQFLAKMQLNYHEEAKKAGVYIIGSCGYDSIPCEMGMKYLRERFPGDLCYVETISQIHYGPDGLRVNFGTFLSVIHAVANMKELKPIHYKLFPERLPKSKFAPASKLFFYSDEIKGWCLPFAWIDKQSVLRSQYHLLAEHKIRPFHVNAYIGWNSLLYILKLLIIVMMLACFAFFSFGRKLLETYPEFFTFGNFTKAGPTTVQIKDSSFTTTLIGIGYEDRLDNPTTDHSVPPDTKLIVKVKGPEAAYVTTPICMIQAGLVILEEMDKLPLKGGVYTPGGAFHNTSLIDRLTKNGLHFIHGNLVKIKCK